MRVLARREPVSRRDARLVVTPGRAASAPVVTTKPSAAGAATERRAGTARRARPPAPTRRRRRVARRVLLLAMRRRGRRWPPSRRRLGLDVAIPAGLLVAWLVACRLMVKPERARATRPRAVAPRRPPRRPRRAWPTAVEGRDRPSFEDTVADARRPDAADRPGGLWDPVPVTLPTYVTKPAAARRTVRTIDLDPPACGPPAAPRSTPPSPASATPPTGPSARGRDEDAERHRAVGS